MASKRARYSYGEWKIEEINRRWVKRLSCYEPVHKYGGDPSQIRWDPILRPPETRTLDQSNYRLA